MLAALSSGAALRDEIHAVSRSIGLYALAGLITALAFVATGVVRVLPHPAPVTLGARILLIPALSRYHFARAFKQTFGVRPHRYHMSRRMERAKTLLEERTRSVTEVGLQLGFAETSSFTTSFRRTVAVTPSDFRRSIL